MTIALSEIPESNIWMEAATLAVVAIGITVMVYGSVALIVKADDVGLMMSNKGRLSIVRALGRGIVKAMPGFLKILMAVGTAAMLWVGGSIVIHGLKELGVKWLYGTIHDVAHGVAHGIGQLEGFVAWAMTATLDGIFGLILGLILIPIVTKLILPVWSSFRKDTGEVGGQ